MNRPLRPLFLMAVAAVIIGMLENVFFGSDHGGLKHQISVGFFFLGIAGLLALVALAVIALTRRVRSSSTS